ncbi:MAG TPA: BLUF domain-containing protein [Sulfuricurvum sp.]|nr:BLUF domain-containing protein [Sulfuricurvum sp.]
MKRIVYTSVPTADTTFATANDILNTAAKANKLESITGMLIFNGKFFMQCIEGPDDAIERLMAKIINDTRHRDIVIIGEERADERFFPQWNMGYLNREKQILDILYTHTASTLLDPATLNMQQATSILVDLSFLI